MDCSKCHYFHGAAADCKVLPPQPTAAAAAEVCSEFYLHDLFLWAHRQSSILLESGFKVVGDKHVAPCHSFRFMTDETFPQIRELTYNTRAGWGIVLNDKGQRLSTFVR